MSYEYKDYFKRLHINDSRKIGADLNENLKIQNELDEVYAQAAEYKEYRADTEKLYNALKAKGEREIQKYKVIADDYEPKNKELLEELKYLKKVNDDLVWQRDTDEEHEAKAKAWDEFIENINKSVDEYQGMFKESGFVHYLDGVEIHEGLLDVANQTLEKYESGESDV